MNWMTFLGRAGVIMFIIILDEGIEKFNFIFRAVVLLCLALWLFEGMDAKTTYKSKKRNTIEEQDAPQEKSQ